MPQQVPRHPDELKRAIIEAAKTGLSGTGITEQLATGQLDGWNGPYKIAAETVRLYIKQHRDQQRANQRSVPLETGLGPALYGSASKLYRELEDRIDQALNAQEPVSIAHLDDLAKTLKTLEGFVKLKPSGTSTHTSTEGQEPVTTDPILTAAANWRPVPKP